MEITCDIAMDLVDIYTNGAASENTENSVREHLKTCKECRSFYAGYKKSLEDEKTEKYIKIETTPYIADEILNESLKKLSKRLRTRRIISNTVGIITVIIGVIFTISECIGAIKGKDYK